MGSNTLTVADTDTPPPGQTATVCIPHDGLKGASVEGVFPPIMLNPSLTIREQLNPRQGTFCKTNNLDS